MKITCAYCRGNVRFENKGYGPKGGQYLVCEGSRRGLTCEAQRWRYQHFEESFLSFMHHEIDFASLRGGQQSERRQTLDRAIEAARGSLSELTIQREKRLNLIDKFDEPEFVVRAVEKTTSEIKQVEETLINLQLERDAVDSEIASLNDGPTRLKELIEILNDSHADIYALRSQLARTIKGVISEIILAPFGEPSGPKSQGTAGPSERFDSLEWAKDDSERLESAILLARILNLRTDARGYYAVRLLNGTLFVDVPPENPLDHPLALEKTNALVVLHKDGFFEIREENAPEVISNADTDHGLAVGIGVVTSNVRTGTCQT